MIVQFDGLVAAVDLSGNLIWVAEQAVPPENVVYGVGSSPVLAGDHVIVIQERERTENTIAKVGGVGTYPSWIEGRSSLDGQMKWHRDLPQGCCTYSTPAVDAVGKIMVVSGNRFLVLSPDDGRVLSDVVLPIWELCSSMVVDGTDVHIVGGAVRAGIFNISLGSVEPMFRWTKQAVSAGCASPLLLDKVLYTVSHNGIAAALDSTNGKTLWRGRLAPGEYYASLVALGSAILAINSDGALSVFEAGPAFKVIGSFQLDEPVIASLAISGGRAFARGDRSLYGLDLMVPPSLTPR